MISINVTWGLNCTDDLRELRMKWEPDNPYYSKMCSGQASLTNITCSYVILLQGECSTFLLNYTGEIYGITSKQKTTKAQQFQFAISQYTTEISILPTNGYYSAPNLTVIAVVVGTGVVLGILLVGLVFGILRRRGAPLIRLENRPVVSESDTEEILSDPIKVLILHASCCMSCKKVIYCLWDVLDSTNLFDVRCEYKMSTELIKR
ncbi:uncharacterized protein LOC116286879 isoform X2 [Actinia tenebrosa]|uniref:Uncharacterized protein LOC116286879 isoform X2 n=1 Tax=Actinia tenebrosa TaxID=6105 RepID=A0A6P8H993_ACTTE|nr:uncharacterized protein LOC116286879 isoform X2 [Actinia tenebrosa]